jgi:8-oxo-dGTP pyrophosphatase MutT (NUDIX family)
MALVDEIKEFGQLPEFAGTEIHKQFSDRASQGRPTRDESPATHFCVYFLPYNPATKQVFIVHHKKARLWISPGGHIDKGETTHEAFQREVKEELGLRIAPTASTRPFLLTISPINNPGHACRTHYDFWYGLPTDGDDFNVDLSEFHETRWLSLAAARELVTETANLAALSKIEDLFS